MKKITPYFLSALISLTIILITGWIAFYSHTSISILHEVCFYFHLIPFGIGFSGGSTSSMVLYYFGLWSVITLVLIPIVKLFNSSKNKHLILTAIISLFTLATITIIWVDQSIKKEREDRILRNKEEDKKDFNSLKTGDVIFQTPIDTESMDNKLAIINVDIHGYTVLEITDRVQHSSLRTWTQNNKKYTIKRLVNADSIFTENNIRKFRTERQKFIFKSYDSSYCWSDDKIYDSELIWKTYKRALHIELCKLDTASISNKNIPDQEHCREEYFISPKDIFESEKLITVMKK